MRVLLCLLLFFTFSCSDSNMDTDPPDDCIPVLIDSSLFSSSENFSVSLSDIALEGNCLNVKLGVSGCDNNHSIEMVTNGIIAKSNPPQITFDFYDKNPQACQAFFMLEREYDLTPINYLYNDEIIINFRNTDTSVKYFK